MTGVDATSYLIKYCPRMMIMCLALAGCTATLPLSSPSGSSLSAASKENFQPIANTTRVFVFPIYSNTGNRAFFDTGAHNASREGRQTPTYKLNVDGHYVATISDRQFVEMDVSPGKYSLEVQELGWLGTLLRSARAPVNIAGLGQVVFIAIPTSASDIALRVVDAEYGTEKLADREKAATDQN